MQTQSETPNTQCVSKMPSKSSFNYRPQIKSLAPKLCLFPQTARLKTIPFRGNPRQWLHWRKYVTA